PHSQLLLRLTRHACSIWRPGGGTARAPGTLPGGAWRRGSDLRALLDDLHDLRDGLVDGDAVLLGAVAVAEGDGPVGHVLIACDDHERHLLLLGVADLLLHAVGGGVHL